MKKTKKALASLAIAGMTLTMIPFNALAADTVSTRLSGNTAVQTSQAISQDGWLTSSDYAVLAPATAYNMVDALAAAPLAAALKAPVLLSAGDQLSAEAKSEIKRLGVKTVYVTSGLAVIKAGVIADLQGLGVQVENLGGFDQYETSVNIAKKIATLTPTTSIFIANGETARVAQDALSVASVAGAQSQPILLTQKGQLPKVVADYIDSIKANVTASYITGGTGVVSDAVKAQLPGTVYRNAGYDAYDTNLEVLKNFTSFDFDRVFVANGETMIDALAGAPLAAQSNSPIVLVNGSVKSATADFLKTKVTSSSVVTALGGTSVVSESVRTGIVNPSPVVVNTVEGSTTSVFQDKGDQVLGVSINGVGKTIADLQAAGYTVQFQATANVFLGGDNQSTDGVLTRDLSSVTTNDEFSYVVNLLKGDTIVATSASRHVNIKEQAAASSVIDSKKVFLQNADGSYTDMSEVTSGKITQDDHALIRIKGTLADDSYSVTTDKMNFSSSDPSIAYVDKSTYLDDTYYAIKTGGHTGAVTITITATDGTKTTLNLTVVDEKRKASASNTSISSTSLNLGTEATSDLAVTVKDQYGDVMKGQDLANSTNPADGDGNLAVVSAEGFDEANWTKDATTMTDYKGRAIIHVEASASNTGSGTFKVKNQDSDVLESVNLNVQAASSESKYKLNLATFKTAVLDASDSLDSHTIASFVGYDSNDNKIGKIDLSGANLPGKTQDSSAKYTVKIDNSTDKSDYLNVAIDGSGRLDISSGKLTKSSSVKVAVFQAGIERASIQVTPGDARLDLSGVTFATNRPTIGSVSGYDLKDFIETSGIKTADGSPVYFENGNDNNIYVEAVDGTILGEINVAVIEGDLNAALTKDDLTVTSNTPHEDGQIVLTVNKLNGGASDPDNVLELNSTRTGGNVQIPENSNYLGSITINVSDLG